MALTRAEVAQIVHDRLGAITEDRGWSYEAEGTLTEGDYTLAIDDVLRTMGSVDADWEPSFSLLEKTEYNQFIDAVEKVMLERATKDSAVLVDVSYGGVSQALSAKHEHYANLAKRGKVIQAPLYFQRKDFPRQVDLERSEEPDRDAWEGA